MLALHVETRRFAAVSVPCLDGCRSVCSGVSVLQVRQVGSQARRTTRDRRLPRSRSLCGSLLYLILAFAFRRSAQYRFMRAETAFRAAADIVRVRCVA